MDSAAQIVGPHAGGILTEVVDDDLIVFNPATESYFTLNRTAREVWNLADGTRTATDILEAVAQRYDVSTDDVDQDVADILERFRHAGLIP